MNERMNTITSTQSERLYQNLSLIFTQGGGRSVSIKSVIGLSVMAVNHDVRLSCIQRRASNRQGRSPLDVETALHWSSVLRRAGTSSSGTKSSCLHHSFSNITGACYDKMQYYSVDDDNPRRHSPGVASYQSPLSCCQHCVG